MNFTNYIPNQFQSVLVYGPPKVGKTELVGELAKQGMNLIWFDLENGVTTLTKLPVEAQQRIELISIPDTKEFPIAVETIEKVIKGNEVSICHEHGKVSCHVCKTAGAESTTVKLSGLDTNTVVVFDSITQLTASAISNIASNKARPDDKFEFADWTKLGLVMENFLSKIQQAKFHVVCISHETEAEMEDGKNRLVPVAGTRNFSRNTAKFFAHVVYAQVTLGKHKFTSSTTGLMSVSAGSRLGIVTETMAAPSLISIFKNNLATPQTNGQKSAGALASLLTVKK